MNKTTRVILQAISYIVTLLLGSDNDVVIDH